MTHEFLFRGPDLALVLDSQRKSLREKIEAFSPDYVLHVDENGLIDALTGEFSLHTPSLNIDGRSIERSKIPAKYVICSETGSMRR
jgi:hypothetical protein